MWKSTYVGKTFWHVPDENNKLIQWLKFHLVFQGRGITHAGSLSLSWLTGETWIEQIHHYDRANVLSKTCALFFSPFFLLWQVKMSPMKKKTKTWLFGLIGCLHFKLGQAISHTAKIWLAWACKSGYHKFDNKVKTCMHNLVLQVSIKF